VAAQFVCALGAYFYMSAGLGCGPRDALMTSLAKRLPKVGIGVIRAAMETAALVIGYLLGAEVGAGTVISMFGVSVFVHLVFRIMGFDVKSVKQEDMLSTLNSIVCLHMGSKM